MAIPIDPSYLLTQILNGLVWGMVLALIAMGLSLIFGLLDIVNFAHGAFYAFGAYIAWQTLLSGGNYWTALIIVPIASVLLAIIVETLLIRRLYGQDMKFTLIFNFGLMLVLVQSFRSIWGKMGKPFFVPNILDFSVDLGIITYPAYRLFVLALSFGIALAVYLFLKKTHVGIAVRAGIQNREMVQALGIDISKIYTLVYCIGIAIAGIAGLAAAPLFGVYPEMGTEVLIPAFVVVVIGGMGSFHGSIIAGILVGQVATLPILWEPRIAQVMIYVFMAIVLLARPAGLFGELGR
ncbi:branched-chain amino acid ABC transporter permease [[Eubacterium] cellulosolvens]